MAYNDAIKLVTVTATGVDEYGNTVATETKKTVFAQCCSIGMKEFYEANANGFQPELKFRIADNLDYSNEKLIEHNNIRYRVLRTYQSGNELELTVCREVNGQ